ncbi:MAG TPA: hypothetical protein DCY07_05475 [Rhodospirillaceae bacterium]|nr:hypothetical protein [Rhodospirillaceae bacterium]
MTSKSDPLDLALIPAIVCPQNQNTRPDSLKQRKNRPNANFALAFGQSYKMSGKTGHSVTLACQNDNWNWLSSRRSQGAQYKQAPPSVKSACELFFHETFFSSKNGQPNGA